MQHHAAINTRMKKEHMKKKRRMHSATATATTKAIDICLW